MQFDDRLATVLRTAARSETGARTQYRQLLDLLGTLDHEGSDLTPLAYQRLEALAGELPAAVQSRILREPGLRLRNRELVAWLATGEPQAAAAAMATARLSEIDWQYLVPRLPVTARGFLRHRRDLPLSVRQLLERLGVTDLVLPEPPRAPRETPPQPSAPLSGESDQGIGALVRRIEAFRRTREQDGSQAMRASLPDAGKGSATNRFDFATDAQGAIVWADRAMAPLCVGMTLGPVRTGAVAQLDPESARALALRLPVRGGQALLDGPAAIAGAWAVDAAPSFDPVGGAFTGYHGRMRRPLAGGAAPAAASDTKADRMRQMLHELRTPVNAIQGFAEIIQQQLFGHVPNEYRALAAGVAVDAARLMAGFDELDRLTRLESGTLELDDGSSDLREVIARLLRRVEGVLRPRSARLMLSVSGSPFTVPLEETDAMRLAWRLLATIAGSMAPGEVLELELAGGDRVVLRAELPASLQEEADMFAAGAHAQPRAISAGMFGSGFAFRLARAEAAAAGGTLCRQEDTLTLDLPALTAPPGVHTVAS